MINNFKYFFTYLFLLIPIALITGPAIPDIIISFGGIFTLFYFIFINKKILLIKNYLVQISIIFWIAMILISFFAIEVSKSVEDALIFLRFLIIPIACYYLFFKSEKILNYLFFFTFILVIFVSIDTLFQFFNYTSKDGFGNDLLGFKSNWYGRLTGPFGDELIPGSYVSKFGLIGFVYLLINTQMRYNNLIKLLYLSIILVVCYVSGERMAFATFSLALILLLFLDKNKIVVLASIIIGLTSLLLLHKYHPFYNDYEIVESNEFHQGLKIEKKFVCENNKKQICKKIINVQPSFIEIISNFSTSAYGEIYLLSFQMFKDNPITGIGISNFKILCESEKKYTDLMINYDCASHPHNTYIQWLTEGGIIMFTLFIVYIISLISFIANNNGEKNYKIISLVLLLILFWPIMSTGSLIKNWYGIIVFFIIGISLCLSNFKKNY